MISLLLWAIRFETSSGFTGEAGGQYEHCDDSGRTLMLSLRPEVWRSVIVFYFLFLATFFFNLGVIQVATILSSSRLNLHVQVVSCVPECFQPPVLVWP